MNIKKKWRDESGASMIEAVITIPLFFMFFLFCLFVSFMYNANVSLSQAVGTVRLAYTRGNTDLSGGEIINGIQAWKSSFPCNPDPGDSHIKDLLATPDQQAAAFANNGHYNAMSLFKTGGLCFNQLPAEHIYAQIYAQQSMKQSVGDVKFPCNPNDPDGAGCMQCEVELPESGVLDQGYIALKCQYRPSSILIEPLGGLFSMLTGGYSDPILVLERKQVFENPRART